MIADTSGFQGPGAIFALLLAEVRTDYQWASKKSNAFRTAEKFLDGGGCEHWLCEACGDRWEDRRCVPKPGYSTEGQCLRCWHPLVGHSLYGFDWTKHRNLVLGALGYDVDWFVATVKALRP